MSAYKKNATLPLKEKVAFNTKQQKVMSYGPLRNPKKDH